MQTQTNEGHIAINFEYMTDETILNLIEMFAKDLVQRPREATKIYLLECITELNARREAE